MSAAVRAKHFARARKKWDDASEGCLYSLSMVEVLQDPVERAEMKARVRPLYYAARQRVRVYGAAMTRAYLQRNEEEVAATGLSLAELSYRMHWGEA